MKKFFILIFNFCLIFLIISCSSDSFKDKMIEVDNEGRDLSVTITYPEDNLHTYLDAVTMTGNVTDNANKIEAVQVKINSDSYVDVTLDGFAWEKDVELTQKVNTVCVRLKTDIGGIEQECKTIYKTFEKLTEYPGNAFKAGSCAVHNGNVYKFGGEDDSDVSGDEERRMAIYNISLNSWGAPTAMNGGASSFQYSAAVKAGGDIYLMGGFDEDEDPILDNNNYYRVSDNSWHQFSVPVNQNVRISSQAVYHAPYIYLISGGSALPNQNVVFNNTVLKFDTNSLPDNLLPIPELDSLNYPRVGFLSVVVGDVIYVIGGYNSALKVMNKVEALDLSEGTPTWQEISPLSKPRMLMVGGVINNRFIYVVGGLNFDGKLTEIEVFDTQTGEWETAGITDYTISEPAFCADENNNTIYLIGGMLHGESKETTFYKFTPEVN